MSSELFSLAGRSALITGANTGIGQGIAVALAAAGADIVAVGRSAPDETAAQVRAVGRRFYSIQADLAAAVHAGEIVRQAAEQMGTVDILVNNAGTIRRNGALEFTEAEWDEVLNVNLKSAFFLSQAVAKHMLGRGRGQPRDEGSTAGGGSAASTAGEQGRARPVATAPNGKIINIASMLSFQGGIRVASYTASKSGIAGVTRLLANEWAAQGINVNAIAPGYIATNNTAALRADQGRNRDILARIPAGRWGRPDDLAGAAVFLASRASDYVHGAILAVDGGWLAR